MHWTKFLSIHRDRLCYQLLRLLDRLRRQSPRRLFTTRCATFPSSNSVENNIIYLTQAGRINKWVSFRCPGNCGNIVRLRLSSSETPHWNASTDWLGRVTINPSVRQLTTCRCHFWIRRSCIQWCADTPLFRQSSATVGFSSTSLSEDQSS